MKTNITYRGSVHSATIASGTVVNKNAPLTNAEIDGNFKSIQDALANLTMDANTINFTPTTTLVSTNVQGAIQEVDDKFLDKQDTLFSGTNIKTVGGQTVLGAGNIDLVTISGQSLIGTTDIKFKTVEGQSIVGTGDVNFVSINGNSLLGTGDLVLSSLQINDSTTTSTTETWSAKHINDEMIAMGSSVKNDLLGGAGPSFDTLNELADALASGTGLEVALMSEISSKQDTLVDSGAGANFKTVEGQSLLGAGNIDFVTVGGQSLLGTGDIKIKNVGGTSLIGTGNVELKTINSASIVGTGNIAVPSINDNSSSTTETWSASKISTELAGKNGDVTQTGTQTLTNKTITGLKETFASMSSNTIDLSAGNVFAKTISGATTLSVTNAATAGSVSTFILELTNAGTNVTWWSNIRWANGTAPTLTASGTDILGFYTRDGGSNWRGLVLSINSK